MIIVYKILVGKPERMRSFGRARRRREYNIKMDLKEKVMRMWTAFAWLSVGSSG
jgi:hypothetical protein